MGHLGPSGSHLEPSWNHQGSSWKPCWAILAVLEAILAVLEAILAVLEAIWLWSVRFPGGRRAWPKPPRLFFRKEPEDFPEIQHAGHPVAKDHRGRRIQVPSANPATVPAQQCSGKEVEA